MATTYNSTPNLKRGCEELKYNELCENFGDINAVEIIVEDGLAVIKYTSNGESRRIESNDTSFSFIVQSVLYVNARFGSHGFLPNH